MRDQVSHPHKIIVLCILKCIFLHNKREDKYSKANGSKHFLNLTKASCMWSTLIFFFSILSWNLSFITLSTIYSQYLLNLNYRLSKGVRKIKMRLKNASKWPEFQWPIWPFNQSSEPNKRYKRGLYCHSRQVCVFMCTNNDLAFIHSTPTLSLLSNFSAAWVYKICDSDVWLRRQRSTLKLLTEWPKADSTCVSTKHTNASSCVSEKSGVK
jgi:hypothetical protein